MKEYTKEETTVFWQAEKCVHSGICLMGLPKVFNLKKRPWIDMDGADLEAIEQQVAKCPSGALTIKGKSHLREELLTKRMEAGEATQVTVTRGGPVIVSGPVVVQNPNGRTWHEGKDVAFCRCGQSGNFPFCDGTHAKH